MELPNRLGVRDIGSLYASGDASPVEIVRHCLDRIERIDPVINSYLTVTSEAALARARQAEAEIRADGPRGPLHGVPYAAKDLLDTKGLPTTVGSPLLAGSVVEEDAAAIEALDSAGAILIGKTGLHELAYGITSANPHYGPVRNPWDPDRIPGGSSGGSAAALAAGLCAFSLGSDTGGSIRIPAALCGVTGLKPTFGRISRRGAFPLGHSLDTVGPFGLTVEDVGLAYRDLCAWDSADPASVKDRAVLPSFDTEPSLQEVAIGVPSDFFFDGLHSDVAAATNSALAVLADLGAEIRETPMPDVRLANSLHRLILLAEASSVHRRRVQRQRDAIGEDVRALLEQGLLVSASDYLDAQRARRRFCQEMAVAIEDFDALVLPGIPIPTARIGQLEIPVAGGLENVRLATTRNIRSLNLTGFPVLSVPCGFFGDGMPIGLQIVGPALGESSILAIGHAYQSATSWHLRAPHLARWEDPTDTPAG